MRQRRDKNRDHTLHNSNTEPLLPSVTAPIPAYPDYPADTRYLPAPVHESWGHRLFRAIGNFIAAVVRKINQLLGLALAVLLLLLFTRFLLILFGVTDTTPSLFAHWIFLVTTPITSPCEHLVDPIPYAGYIIDVTTLIAIVVSTLAVMIVRQCLRVLAGK